MSMTSTDETFIFVALNFVEVIIFTTQNKFVYQVYFICRRKDFHDEDNNIAVTRYLLRDGMSMGKVTKAFSYYFNVFHMSHSPVEVTKAFSYYFNVFHMSHSLVEGGTERFLIELVELNTLNESTFCMNLYCVKGTFLIGKTIFDKAMKLVEGGLIQLQCASFHIKWKQPQRTFL